MMPKLGFNYTKDWFVRDLIAGVIAAALLVPQSIAYAMLAGLPPEVGLYSSIVPLLAYAMIGTSTSLSVGPVAVISLMTATTLGGLANSDLAQLEGYSYLLGAVTLAGLSGLVMLVLAVLRLGSISNFLSHTVVSGFVSASCVLIVLSQLRHMLGVDIIGSTAPELLLALYGELSQVNLLVVMTGGLSLVFLLLARSYGAAVLTAMGLSEEIASLLAKLSPLILLVTAVVMVAPSSGDMAPLIPVVGDIPSGLPSFFIALPSYALISHLFLPAVGIALIAYIESISIAQALAARKRETVDVNRELAGLGAANLGAAVCGGMPVAGGFSRSAVNHEAGAATRMSSVVAALMVAIVSLCLTSYLYYLPKAVLAAMIIVAVVGLLDFRTPLRSFRYSKSDFVSIMTTIITTLLAGVEVGVMTGLATSLLLHLYRTSKPHIAEVGLLEGSEHFRNVERYEVETSDKILSLRQDESLFFANAHQLEQRILHELYKRDAIAHVVLQCSAINEIDFSALEMLEDLNRKLLEQGVMLHLSELKGPVYDKLKTSSFLSKLSGEVFLSQFSAYQALSK